jgi:hypothetical protein
MPRTKTIAIMIHRQLDGSGQLNSDSALIRGQQFCLKIHSKNCHQNFELTGMPPKPVIPGTPGSPYLAKQFRKMYDY